MEPRYHLTTFPGVLLWMVRGWQECCWVRKVTPSHLESHSKFGQGVWIEAKTYYFVSTFTKFILGSLLDIPFIVKPKKWPIVKTLGIKIGTTCASFFLCMHKCLFTFYYIWVHKALWNSFTSFLNYLRRRPYLKLTVDI